MRFAYCALRAARSSKISSMRSLIAQIAQKDRPGLSLSLPYLLWRAAQRIARMITAADELADRRGADRRREIVAAPRQHDIGDVLFALPRRRDRRLAAHPSRGPDVIVVTGYQDDIAFDFCKWN